jgi:hypothetical protein
MQKTEEWIQSAGYSWYWATIQHIPNHHRPLAWPETWRGGEWWSALWLAMQASPASGAARGLLLHARRVCLRAGGGWWVWHINFPLLNPALEFWLLPKLFSPFPPSVTIVCYCILLAEINFFFLLKQTPKLCSLFLLVCWCLLASGNSFSRALFRPTPHSGRHSV